MLQSEKKTSNLVTLSASVLETRTLLKCRLNHFKNVQYLLVFICMFTLYIYIYILFCVKCLEKLLLKVIFKIKEKKINIHTKTGCYSYGINTYLKAQPYTL